MNSTNVALIVIDVAAALLMAFAIYYPRHRRRDLVVAFLGVNVGVLAVASVLSTTNVAIGLGLGLFGALSIIRLRSSEISQREVAYYFAAIAMGLVGGLPDDSLTVPTVLIVLMLVVLWAVDHPSLLARSRNQIVRLDRAIADEAELRRELAARLGADITAITVQRLDLVNDTTQVDVRYRLKPPGQALPPGQAPAPAQPPAPGYPGGAPNQGYPSQGYPGQGYPGQGSPAQPYPGQAGTG